MGRGGSLTLSPPESFTEAYQLALSYWLFPVCFPVSQVASAPLLLRTHCLSGSFSLILSLLVTSLSILDLVDFSQFVVVVSTYVVSFFFGELPPGKGSGD